MSNNFQINEQNYEECLKVYYNDIKEYDDCKKDINLVGILLFAFENNQSTSQTNLYAQARLKRYENNIDKKIKYKMSVLIECILFPRKFLQKCGFNSTRTILSDFKNFIKQQTLGLDTKSALPSRSDASSPRMFKSTSDNNQRSTGEGTPRDGEGEGSGAGVKPSC